MEATKYGLIIDVAGGDVVHIDGCPKIHTWEEQSGPNEYVVLDQAVAFGAAYPWEMNAEEIAAMLDSDHFDRPFTLCQCVTDLATEGAPDEH